MTCGSCGTANRPGARFCDACGAALAATGPGARKVVTVVFADLVGSTALQERLDAESARDLMARYYAAVRAAVEAHAGTVVKLLGDGVMAAFGVPQVAEDDALRAVRAGVEMQRAVRALVAERADAGRGLGTRVGIQTGEVVVQEGASDIVGDPVNVAAHLQAHGRDGDVLLGEATRRLVADRVTLAPFGTLALKGRAEAVPAYRVVSLDPPAAAPALAFVGREDEVRRLVTAYEATVEAPQARLVLVLGSPGLGKSRLLAELAARLEPRACVLRARCEAASGDTFAPVAEALRGLGAGDAVEATLAGVLASDPARARVAAGIRALLAGSPAPTEETFFAIRRLLAALAGRRPVVLVIDDLHCAGPLLLDLIEHLIRWSGAVPLLLVAAARPELGDPHPALAAGGPLVADVVTLGGLDAAAAARLAADVVGTDVLPAAVAGRVLAASEGNPLFVTELVRMLVHDGALTRHDGEWVAGAELARLEMPPSIQAVLAARIERLSPADRTVLERAAVLGRRFSRPAVAHLLPAATDALDARLESLRRHELIEPDPAPFLGDPALRFHHALIRDAAYRRLLKGTRAELHARVADWIATRQGLGTERDDIIGGHLEQAHGHLRELGPLDAGGRMIGTRAAQHLAAAGRRALGRDDLLPAARLLERALACLATDDAARAEIALDWCEALLSAGDMSTVSRALDELDRFADRSPRLRAWHTCFVGQRAVFTSPHALHETADALAEAAALLAAVPDPAGEAKAHGVRARALARLGQLGACETALDLGLEAARRAGDRRRTHAVLGGAPLAALWGPSPVAQASGRCLDVVRVLRTSADVAPSVEAIALRCQGVLEALRGRVDTARELIATARRMVEDLGVTQRILEADVFAGLVAVLDGDALAAERCVRPAYEGLRAHGLAIDAAQAAALLGRALLAQGRAAEAEALSHESEALVGDDVKSAISWRGVRAEALSARGEHDAAVALAGTAVELAAATDALLDHADARRTHAAVLRAAGRTEAAAGELARAVALWDAKGASLLADRARRDLALPPAPVAASDAPAAPRFENAAWRATADLPARALLATRGDRLALLRVGAGEPGSAWLALVEVDAGGDQVARLRFPSAALDAAHAELDTRYAAAEAAPYPQTGVYRAFGRAFATRDWDAMRDLLAPEIVVHDHRVLGWAPLRGPAAYVAAIRDLVALAPDTALRIDHVRMTPRAALCMTTWTGTRDGGAFETPSITVFALDGRGRPRRFDQYDVQQLDDALGRLAAATDVPDA